MVLSHMDSPSPQDHSGVKLCASALVQGISPLCPQLALLFIVDPLLCSSLKENEKMISLR